MVGANGTRLFKVLGMPVYNIAHPHISSVPIILPILNAEDTSQNPQNNLLGD